MAGREYLLGDAWGARPALEDLGLNLDVSFALNVAGNAVGGANQGVTQVNSTGVNFGVDFEKLADVGRLDVLRLDGIPQRYEPDAAPHP